MSRNATTQIMVVDDEPDVHVMLTLLLEQGGAKLVVTHAGDAAQALSAIGNLPTSALPKVMIVDFGLPDTNGLDLAEKILAVHPGLPIILYSASLDQQTRNRAASIGIRACVPKDHYLRLPGIVQALSGRDKLIPERSQSPDRATAS